MIRAYWLKRRVKPTVLFFSKPPQLIRVTCSHYLVFLQTFPYTMLTGFSVPTRLCGITLWGFPPTYKILLCCCLLSSRLALKRMLRIYIQSQIPIYRKQTNTKPMTIGEQGTPGPTHKTVKLKVLLSKFLCLAKKMRWAPVATM